MSDRGNILSQVRININNGNYKDATWWLRQLGPESTQLWQGTTDKIYDALNSKDGKGDWSDWWSTWSGWGDRNKINHADFDSFIQYYQNHVLPNDKNHLNAAKDAIKQYGDKGLPLARKHLQDMQAENPLQSQRSLEEYFPEDVARKLMNPEGVEKDVKEMGKLATDDAKAAMKAYLEKPDSSVEKLSTEQLDAVVKKLDGVTVGIPYSDPDQPVTKDLEALKGIFPDTGATSGAAQKIFDRVNGKDKASKKAVEALDAAKKQEQNEIQLKYDWAKENAKKALADEKNPDRFKNAANAFSQEVKDPDTGKVVGESPTLLTKAFKGDQATARQVYEAGRAQKGQSTAVASQPELKSLVPSSPDGQKLISEVMKLYDDGFPQLAAKRLAEDSPGWLKNTKLMIQNFGNGKSAQKAAEDLMSLGTAHLPSEAGSSGLAGLFGKSASGKVDPAVEQATKLFEAQRMRNIAWFQQQLQQKPFIPSYGIYAPPKLWNAPKQPNRSNPFVPIPVGP